MQLITHTVTRYQADDGQIFETEAGCKDWEAKVKRFCERATVAEHLNEFTAEQLRRIWRARDTIKAFVDEAERVRA